jgi:hypothetical protein
MVWKRRGHRLYLYRMVREHGKIRTVYVGTGPAAEAIYAEAERERAQREADRSLLQQQLRHLNNRTTDPEQLNLSSSLLTDASFLIAGYWQHANGDWRKKHDR